MRTFLLLIGLSFVCRNGRLNLVKIMMKYLQSRMQPSEVGVGCDASCGEIFK